MKKNWNWRFVLEKNKPHQFFRVTKLTFFLCLCVMTSLEASVTAQQRLTMKLGKAGIREIFNEIQKQTSKTSKQLATIFFILVLFFIAK